MNELQRITLESKCSDLEKASIDLLTRIKICFDISVYLYLIINNQDKEKVRKLMVDIRRRLSENLDILDEDFVLRWGVCIAHDLKNLDYYYGETDVRPKFREPTSIT